MLRQLCMINQLYRFLDIYYLVLIEEEKHGSFAKVFLVKIESLPYNGNPGELH